MIESMNKRSILALGADIKNRFLFERNDKVSFGPDIGDLSEVTNFGLFKSSILKTFKSRIPDVMLSDMHPGYFSTRFADELNRTRRASRVMRIQHHHAHIASVIREHSVKGPVIGVSFDGTGFGTDGNMWGGEFLLVEKKGFSRLGHFKYLKMPGGEKVITEPWRMVVSILGRRGIGLLKTVRKKEGEMVLSMCDRGINAPLASSVGRLFDAAAALLGIAERSSYEAEGPIKLESLCRNGIRESYEFITHKADKRYIIDTLPVFTEMIADIRRKKKTAEIATKFHNSIVNIITGTVSRLSRDSGIKKVALSGGVFQNKLLKTEAIRKLCRKGFTVFINKQTPANDFNISSGQYHVFSSTGKN